MSAATPAAASTCRPDAHLLAHLIEVQAPHFHCRDVAQRAEASEERNKHRAHHQPACDRDKQPKERLKLGTNVKT